VCGFRLRDEAPPTYPHVLAFPLVLRLMTARDFPLRPIGLVHVGNRIVQRRPVTAGERLTLRVRADALHGSRFDIVTEASAGDLPVWEERSTYLRPRGGGGGRRATEPPPEPQAVWSVPGNIGRRYAAVSGDRNPIHLRRLTARAFGQPRPIAHGMWVKARCLAALEGRVPEACAVEVRFHQPLRLPGTVAFASWPDGDGRAFAVHGVRDGRPHVTGRITARR
jgi:acyl dehydratase